MRPPSSGVPAFKGIKGPATPTQHQTARTADPRRHKRVARPSQCHGETMSRINTNVSSLIAQRVLKKNNDSLNKSLERLSTGLKINSGADNPAGLIASENLRA